MNDMTTPPIPEGYMEDAQGRLIPLANIPAIDQLRDGMVKHLIAAAKKVQEDLAGFKNSVIETLHNFMEMSAEQYGVILPGAQGKGNVTFRSYDGRFMVKIAIGETMDFDERLQFAKQLIDECLTEWSENGNPNLRVVVFDAFQVRTAGRIDTKRVLSLRSYEIKDEKWQRAMVAITASLITVASKSYIRFYERDDKTGKYDHISLDLAAV